MSAKDVRVNIRGRTYTLYQLSQVFPVSWDTVRHRYFNYQVGENLIRPVHKIHVPMNGKRYTLHQLSHEYQVNLATVYSRYYAGKRGRALVRPPQSAMRPEQKQVLREADTQHIHFHRGRWTFHTLAQAYGLPTSAVRDRYYRGDRNDELVRPLHQRIRRSYPAHHVVIHGKWHTLQEVSREYGLDMSVLHSRYYQGERGQDLVRPYRRYRRYYSQLK